MEKHMTNSRARGSLIKVANYEASGTSNTETFTLNPIFDPKQYAKIIIQVEGKLTATANIQMVINAITTSTYFQEGFSAITTTLAAVNVNAATQFNIHTAGGTNAFNIYCELGVMEATDTTIFGNVRSHNMNGESYYNTAIYNSTSTTTITTIEIKTSTSTWIAGTRITIWMIQR